MTTTNDDDGLQPVIRDGDEPPQAFVQIRKRPQKTTWPWLVGGMVFIVMTSVLAGFGADWEGGDSLASAVGYGLGYSLIPGLVLGLAVYLVIYFAALRRSKRDNGGWYLAALVGTALLSGVAMSVLVGRLQPAPFDVVAVRAAVEISYAEQAAARTRVEQEVAKADPDIFTPAGLKRRGGYDRASAELERRRALMTEAIGVSEASAARLRASIAAAIPNPAHRRRGLAEFDASYEVRRTAVMAAWERQKRLIDLTQQQLDLLRGSRWTPQGDAYMFYRQGDLDAFDARQVEIDRLTADSAAEVQRLNRQMEDSRSEVEALLGRLD